jgi:NAD(P)-dependent dehydrogenase (short-subunit alcohol dehydrogenase family)
MPVTERAGYPSLRDRRVIVTGGGTGIGAAIVEAFAVQGARVAFLDIADEASRALANRYPAVTFRRVDLTDLDDLRTGLAASIAELGGVDVLVNNAANDDRHGVADVTPAYWDDRIAVNLRHVFFAAQAAAAAMVEGGVILNLGSISWHVALPDLVLYQTAKAGIEGMTRALARDLGPRGIRVNTIVPGAVKTPRQDALWHDPAEERRILDAQCLKARVLPADVAALALFLASDDARMITGHDYFVDAGWC